MATGHKSRMDYYAAQPQLLAKLSELSIGIHKAGLDKKLIALVEIRASQINKCAFCIDMHAKQAKLAGERELRIYALSAWRESTLFDDRERAALEWTEAVTMLGEHGVSDDAWEIARAQFTDAELSQLTLTVAIINAWNRLAISFRAVPGSMDKQYGLDRAGLS